MKLEIQPLSDSPKRMGRPPLNVTFTGVRLPHGVAERIDVVMGKGQKRAEFIRQAVIEKLERLEAERGIKPKAAKKPPRKLK